MIEQSIVSQNIERKYYSGIDALRAFSAIGILMMHVRANSSFQISGFVYNRLIPSFSDLVFLFMTISAFALCSGYYNKVIQNQFNAISFYKKRYSKILPFFMVLILIDLFHSPSLPALIESITNVTCLYGLLPNCGNITVIGVGWFIGVIFIFYLLFPFFCALLNNKKVFFLMLLLSIVFNLYFSKYYNIDRTNFLFCLMFFIIGGGMYLYTNIFSSINYFFIIFSCCISYCIYLFIDNQFKLLLYLLFVIFVLLFSIKSTNKLKNNRLISFLSSISMEIYLSHMLIFRIVEKTGHNSIIENDLLQYSVTVLLVLVGTIVFSYCTKVLLINLFRILSSRSKKCILKN